METYMLVVHVDADSKEQAIEHVEKRCRLPFVELSGDSDYSFVHIETLEGYCDSCETRCQVQNCDRRE